jgi:hypothetical protein
MHIYDLSIRDPGNDDALHWEVWCGRKCYWHKGRAQLA